MPLRRDFLFTYAHHRSITFTCIELRSIVYAFRGPCTYPQYRSNIHWYDSRVSRPFVSINATLIPALFLDTPGLHRKVFALIYIDKFFYPIHRCPKNTTYTYKRNPFIIDGCAFTKQNLQWKFYICAYFLLNR